MLRYCVPTSQFRSFCVQEIDLSDSFLSRDSIHAMNEDADASLNFSIDTSFFCIVLIC